MNTEEEKKWREKEKSKSNDDDIIDVIKGTWNY